MNLYLLFHRPKLFIKIAYLQKINLYSQRLVCSITDPELRDLKLLFEAAECAASCSKELISLASVWWFPIGLIDQPCHYPSLSTVWGTHRCQKASLQCVLFFWSLVCIKFGSGWGKKTHNTSWYRAWAPSSVWEMYSELRGALQGHFECSTGCPVWSDSLL